MVDADKIEKIVKEDLAKFLEEPTRERLREFLKNHLGELENCDFKEKWVEISKLARHILALSNSKGGCIFVGVKQLEDNSFEPVGLDVLEDKAKITGQIRKFLPEKLVFNILDFSYGASEYEKIRGKNFQVIIVDDNPKYIPFVCLYDGDDARKVAIYFRKGTESIEADYENLQDIINRRLESGYSSRSENELEKELAHLKVLYDMIPEYYHTLGMLSMGFLGGMQRKNPKYPNEGFEDFVLRMIVIKKRIVESIVKRYLNQLIPR